MCIRDSPWARAWPQGECNPQFGLKRWSLAPGRFYCSKTSVTGRRISRGQHPRKQSTKCGKTGAKPSRSMELTPEVVACISGRSVPKCGFLKVRSMQVNSGIFWRKGNLRLRSPGAVTQSQMEISSHRILVIRSTPRQPPLHSDCVAPEYEVVLG